MGMFDNIKCDMPLSKGAEDVREWQTKDLSLSLAHYAIRENGQLVDARIRRELKPGAPEEPAMSLSEWFSWRDKWWELKEGPDIPIHHTGSVTFYGDDSSGERWEFCAFFEDGICFKICQISPSAKMTSETN